MKGPGSTEIHYNDLTFVRRYSRMRCGTKVGSGIVSYYSITYENHNNGSPHDSKFFFAKPTLISGGGFFSHKRCLQAYHTRTKVAPTCD